MANAQVLKASAAATDGYTRHRPTALAHSSERKASQSPRSPVAGGVKRKLERVSDEYASPAKTAAVSRSATTTTSLRQPETP